MAVHWKRILIMKLFKSLLLLTLVFFAGIVVGVVATRVVVRHVVREAILHPDRAQVFMERNLTRKLQLDNGQQVKLHEILSAAHGQLKDLRREYQPQFFEVLSNANGQIIAILTPEQQAKFEQLKSENRPFLRAIQQNH
jgi:Spy/CpxP family protein refolding chaperone